MKQLTVLSLLLFAIGACSQEQQTPETNNASGIIEIEDGWVRPGNAGMMTAAYFNINNGTNSADSLLSVESNVTDDTQIHESYEKEDGMMGMRGIGLVPVPANAVTELKPGGIHIMIIRPFQDVSLGDSVDFELYFLESGSMEITLPVKSSANE